jgi:hypothetical protein
MVATQQQYLVILSTINEIIKWNDNFSMIGKAAIIPLDYVI